MAAVLGAVGLVIALCAIWNQVLQSQQDARDMQGYVDTLYQSLQNGLDDVTDEMDEKFRQNNSLTVDYQTQHLSTDVEANTATFQLWAIPKTFVPGMTAVFQARSGENITELAVEPDANNAFSGEITCPLTDDITLSVVLVTGEVERTQWLDDYSGLYSSSFPRLSFAFGMPFVDENGVLPAQSPQNGTGIEAFDPFDGSELSTEGMELRKGLFRDDQLLMWYEEAVVERSLNDVSTPVRVWYRPQAVTLEPGHEYVEAILYTDEYGRQRVYQDAPLTYDETTGDWISSGIYTIASDPIGWKF